mmetsp:Transcript_36223/g.67342  ORF Transcript_36223/g.67342 Transcript_36223/m.67342 type:complete len:491 (+) Transcript_36223:168-1640(+)
MGVAASYLPDIIWCQRPPERALSDNDHLPVEDFRDSHSELGIGVRGVPTPARAASAQSDPRQLAERLGALLEDAPLALDLQCSTRANVIVALIALAEQAVCMGIDYATLGLGWNHPRSRKQYRSLKHESIQAPPSRQRAEASRRRLVWAVKAIVNGTVEAQEAVTSIFVSEIGLLVDSPPGSSATFSGVSAALAAELLLPMRAMVEGLLGDREVFAWGRVPLPQEELRRTVYNIIGATLSGPDGFTRWRYSNEVGQEQLRGLTRQQLEYWQKSTEFMHESGLRTHEDAPGELGFFWATKIGGPSHGFDYEGHCLLPLLANARHKVLMVSDPPGADLPTARCHWRLVWSADREPPEPRLWLEALHTDHLSIEVLGPERLSRWMLVILAHAMTKADLMGIVLSVDAKLAAALRHVKSMMCLRGSIWVGSERILLRPSNGVVEASDELSDKHDWMQVVEEVTPAVHRAIYVPCTPEGKEVVLPALDWTLQQDK